MFKLEPKSSRKLKRIPIYRLRKSGGVLEKHFKFVDLKQFKKFYNINKTNRVSGFLPDYVGFRPSSPVLFPNEIIHFYTSKRPFFKTNYPSLYKSFIKSASKYRDVWTGSPDSNTGHMRNILKDNRKNGLKAEEMIRIASKSNWFKIPIIDYKDPRELLFTTNYNPNSHNGHYTSKILGSPFKGYSIVGASRMAIDKYNQVRKLPTKNYCIWDVFSREKDSKIDPNDDNKDYSTRVVVNPEHHITVLASWMVSKHMNAYELAVDGKKKWFIGGELNGEKVKIILDRISKYDFFVDTDWTQFDASADTEELLAVNAIALSNSYTDKPDMRLLFWFASSIIQKFIALPPGIVVECNRANPSGHPAVTMVNCYLNLIRWAVIGYNLYGENYHDYMDAIVYGDDGLIMFRNNPKLMDIDSIISSLGYEMDPIAEKLYPTDLINQDIHSNPDFLKRRFTSQSICWNREKIFDKLIYQSKTRSFEDQISLIKGFIETAPSDDEFNRFGIDVINFICYKHGLDSAKYQPTIDLQRFTPCLPPNPLKGFDWEKSLISTRVEIDMKRIESLKTVDNFDSSILMYLAEDPYFINDYKIHFQKFFRKSLEQCKLSNLFLNFGFSDVYLHKLMDVYLT